MEETSVDINPFNRSRENASTNEARLAETQSSIPPPSRPSVDVRSFNYDMSGEKFLLIFNHYDYEKTAYFSRNTPSPRKGTEKDVNRLTEVFKGLGFKVVVYSDKKHSEILHTINNISQQNHSNTACLFIAILTHGEKGDELFASDRPYKLSDLTTLLENGDATLVNKPKVFFLQACRGSKRDSGRKLHFDGGEDSNTIVLPSPVDFLIMYSSSEDYVGFRDENGSWLIQELCTAIEQYHLEMDLLHILTIVIRNIAYNRASYNTREPSIHNKKQAPEIRSRLSKFLRFNH